MDATRALVVRDGDGPVRHPRRPCWSGVPLSVRFTPVVDLPYLSRERGRLMARRL
ncbi:MAG TPA: hypothetical protein VGF12_17060 [Roseateles sp.]|uniref:hypothetical protein n=1 Tax=Roseateles sp. TaxID=1971397 RepID=UPI002EDB802F